MKWNGNPYQPDGGTPEGRSEEDGGAWLLPYWMGRYYGMIAAPAEGAAAETDIAAIKFEPTGAPQYSGPPRPPYKPK